MPWTDDRPMSPHLQIYNLPMTAKISILHRATGAFLLSGMLLIVVVLTAVAMGEQSWLIIKSYIDNWLGLLFLFGLTFSVYFHLCHGIRHLIWDTGKQMEKHKMLGSGLLVIAISSILTAVTWLVAIL